MVLRDRTKPASAAGWKKFEPLWDWMIRARQLNHMTPLLETALSRVTSGKGSARVPVAELLPILSEETSG